MTQAREHAREVLRQQMLLRALWHDAEPRVLAGWTRGGSAALERGLATYAANAAAAAGRALAAQFPTVVELLGAESFATMSRAYWRTWAPERGDLAWLGEHLPEFIAASAALAEEPFLADVARLDALLDAAERAADASPEPHTLALLGEHEPAQLLIELMPGCALLVSAWPIVTIHAAHQHDGADRFEPVREAMAARRGEVALVWRDGLRARVRGLDAAAGRFTEGVLKRQAVAAALEAAGEDFEFEPWLLGAVRQGWLRGVRVLA